MEARSVDQRGAVAGGRRWRDGSGGGEFGGADCFYTYKINL